MSGFAELKQRLMPNRATALLLTALDQCDDLFGDELMWSAVKQAVTPGLYRSSTKRDRLITDDVKAGRMILMLVADYCERQVSSGMMHTYRGILGFDGQSVRNVAEDALRYLNDYEYLDYQDYRDRLDRLDEMVKGAS